jgi:glycosyltransferase involved in cell wall biosynthesis
VRTWRADLVHAHDARGHAIALAALLGRRQIPLVVTRRVTFVPRGRVKYGARVSRFIAISDAVRESLERGGVDGERIDVVYSGVPLPAVDRPRDWRAECGWPGESVICGVVGAMTTEKGVERLAEIARALPRRAAARARLVMLGGASAGSDDVGGVVAFRAGFVDEIHAAMAGLDVLWHPATAEGLGTAVIDAMGLGIPPLAFAVGGLRELVVNEETGVLVPPGDIAAFARAAEHLILDDTRRRRLGAAGPARAQLFSVERMVDGTAAVYDRVLRERAAAS